VTIVYKAWWAAEPVWMLWTKEKFLTHDGNRTMAVQSITHLYTEQAIPAS
jgi:hypothetical protein